MNLRIREIREQRGLTQTALAEKSGISRATIIAIESGENKTVLSSTLLRIAEALGVTLDEIFLPSAVKSAQH